MIAQLTGLIASILDDAVIVDVQGVGYKAFVHGRLRSVLSLKQGEIARLFIETQVREDAITLYGFDNSDEQAWFNLLQKVQGVGARVALAILDILPPNQLAAALTAQDKAAIQRADGVGPKLALRLLTELKDKVPAGLPANVRIMPSVAMATPALNSMADEAVSALCNLGYSRMEALPVVQRLTQNMPANDEHELPALIRRSLQELAR